MDREAIQSIEIYLDEIQDLAKGVDTTKLREIRARVELIKHAIGVTTMVQDTGTGQTLDDYLAYWDRPDADLEADGHSLLVIHAVKDALRAGGKVLNYPAPPEDQVHPGWHRYPAWQPVPPDWADPNKYK